MYMKKAKTTAAAIAMAAITLIGGVSAYFSDGETTTNSFTIGEIKLDLTEPNWNASNAALILPEQEIAKDPTVANNGKNAEYVFVEVLSPMTAAGIVTEAEDGSAIAAGTPVELFTWGYVENGTATEGVRPAWTEVTLATADQTVTKDGVTYKRHVYGYGSASAMTPLAVNANTGALFDYIELINAQEGQGLENAAGGVVVNAYGIQTTNINDGAGNTYNGANADGQTSPAAVWAVLYKDGSIPTLRAAN